MSSPAAGCLPEWGSCWRPFPERPGGHSQSLLIYRDGVLFASVRETEQNPHITLSKKLQELPGDLNVYPSHQVQCRVDLGERLLCPPLGNACQAWVDAAACSSGCWPLTLLVIGQRTDRSPGDQILHNNHEWFSRPAWPHCTCLREGFR